MIKPKYYKETVEFQEVRVSVDGVPHSNFKVCLVPLGDRPEVWNDPFELDGKYGVMIEDMEIGQYWVYVRVEDNPEAPVLLAGTVTIR